MEDLVTLRQAKEHLKLSLDITVEDRDLRLKLAVAQETVIDYLKQRRDDDNGATWAATVESWDADTAPARVRQAILIMFGNLYDDRGDGAERGVVRFASEASDSLPAGVTKLLKRLRDPAVA